MRAVTDCGSVQLRRAVVAHAPSPTGDLRSLGTKTPHETNSNFPELTASITLGPTAQDRQSRKRTRTAGKAALVQAENPIQLAENLNLFFADNSVLLVANISLLIANSAAKMTPANCV